jgi:hypothetical protein
MRVLAASEVVVIIYLTSPDWAYEYAERLGLIDLRSRNEIIKVHKLTSMLVTGSKATSKKQLN